MIGYVTGNILSSDADIILHQVNCKGKMNAGLDLRIKNAYPAVYNKKSRKPPTSVVGMNCRTPLGTLKHPTKTVSGRPFYLYKSL